LLRTIKGKSWRIISFAQLQSFSRLKSFIDFDWECISGCQKFHVRILSQLLFIVYLRPLVDQVITIKLRIGSIRSHPMQ
jgi:hypothetical protein